MSLSRALQVLMLCGDGVDFDTQLLYEQGRSLAFAAYFSDL